MGMVFYAKGLCDPDPGGWSIAAWVGRVVDTGEPFASEAEETHPCSVNRSHMAEYRALLNCLRYAKGAGHQGFEVRMGSKLVVNQVAGQSRCHAPDLRPLYEDSIALLRECKATLVWVPRGHNKNREVERLTCYAYEVAAGRLPENKMPLFTPTRLATPIE